MSLHIIFHTKIEFQFSIGAHNYCIVLAVYFMMSYNKERCTRLLKKYIMLKLSSQRKGKVFNRYIQHNRIYQILAFSLRCLYDFSQNRFISKYLYCLIYIRFSCKQLYDRHTWHTSLDKNWTSSPRSYDVHALQAVSCWTFPQR